MGTSCSVRRATGTAEELAHVVLPLLPDASYRRILLKPNWVTHETNPAHPIRALVTDSRIIEAVLVACLEKYRTVEEIIVGDAPLQTCDWRALELQSGIARLAARFEKRKQPTILFRDLRQHAIFARDGFVTGKQGHERLGDPHGYRQVVLDDRSFLEPISDAGRRFRVSDYDPGETVSSHSRGAHTYTIAASALRAELVINLPKLKTHQKAGITGALKNLVGINGNKASLVHFRKGLPLFGGDEFPPTVSLPVISQVRVRAALRNQPYFIYRTFQRAWRAFRSVYGIEVRSTAEHVATARKFFIAGGSWYGNDTIWRMVYDLNRIIRFVAADGTVRETPQRDYVAILDGIVGGQGNGPLEALPVELGVLASSTDPFALDMTMAALMGFDVTKIPLLANHRAFGDSAWGACAPSDVVVDFDGEQIEGIRNVPALAYFLPAPGWRGRIELLRGASS